MYKIGIDVGGTNTDAVLCTQTGKIINKIKVNTTLDIQTGIEKAIKKVIEKIDINLKDVRYAMLGTTQCTNAIIERKNLEKVSTIRLATGCTRAIKPFCDWPEDLRGVTEENYIITDGGYEYDSQELGAINYEEIEQFVSKSKTKNFAVSSVYAPLKDDHEILVRDYILKLEPDANVSISSEIGSLSLLERENATILNSALKNVIKQVTEGFSKGLINAGIEQADIFICQNDGTVMNIDYAIDHPILTISSGPTNSIRGGATLVAKKDAIIVDIGGTTTDIGAIVNSLARESQGTTDIGGVDSNFRMPDMISLGIGGGTIIRIDGDSIKVGPDSVGHNLVTEALSFGGDILTLTDIAKKLKRTDVGHIDVDDLIDIEIASEVDKIVNKKILENIDVMKVNPDKIDVILVGGGSIVVNPEYFDYDILNVPKNHDVANAIGASIVQVSGSHEGVFPMKGKDIKVEVAKAVALAEQNAIGSGASSASLEVVDIEQTPLSYHPEEAYVIKTKVVGDLKV